MKIFKKYKIKNIKYRIEFSKECFEKLQTIHPFAMHLYVATLIKQAKDRFEYHYFVEPEQDDALMKIITEYKKPNIELFKHELKDKFTFGYQHHTMDVENDIDMLDKIFKFIYS